MSGAASPAPAGALRVQIEQTAPVRLSGRFDCAPGQVLALVGPSGAGKTTLLRVLAGLLRPTQGRIDCAGQCWCDTATGLHLSPAARRLGMVFQHYALMPHLSALDNVALGRLDLPLAQRHALARQWLQRAGLDETACLRRPSGLSGGQQQRVALARALVRQPRLLLLDEAFSAVDRLTRQGLYTLLAEWRQTLDIPIVMVTHDLEEARLLADRLVVMDAGQVLQVGSPAEIYRSPRNARVADVLGIQNRFVGRWLGPDPQSTEPGWGLLEWLPHAGAASGLRLRVRDKGKIPVGHGVTWVIQRDGLRCAAEEGGSAPLGTLVRLPARVEQVRHLGEWWLATLCPTDWPGVSITLTLTGGQSSRLQQGQKVDLQLDGGWVHVMPVR